MKTDGLVVLGARGTLGSAFCSSTKELCAAQFLFDRLEDSNENTFACDLASEEQISSAVKRLPINAHRMWRLLITAGTYSGTASSTLSWSEIRTSIQVNLIGIAQFATMFMDKIYKERCSARIVIISSAAARVGSLDMGYGIAKAGIEGLIRSGSKRYSRHGITIIGVAPGLFPSAMSKNQDSDRKQAAVSQGHLGRTVRLEEVLECVTFAMFAAPDALSGTFISPNGGQVSG